MPSTRKPAQPRPAAVADDRKKGQQWTVAAGDAGQRLDKFLASADRAGSRGRASDAIARGRVFVNDTEATATDGARVVAAGDVVRLWIDRPGSAARPMSPGARGGLAIVYEDDDLVVVNKPAGLLTVPLDSDGDDVDPRAAPSVLDLLQRRFRSHGGREPLVVHRIDRDTSGVVLFALNARTHSALVAQFADRTPERVYQAVLYGRPEPPEGIWHDRLVWDEGACLQRTPRAGELGSIDAISHYRVVETFAAASLVEVMLETGRQGQIRAQAQIHGHALVGDRRYRDRTGTVTRKLVFPRQALHAHRLVLAHPADRRRLEVTAPPPDDLRKLLARLRQGN